MKERLQKHEKNTVVLADTAYSAIGKIDKYSVLLKGVSTDIYHHPELIKTGDLIEYAAIYSDLNTLITKPIIEKTYKRKGTDVNKYIAENTNALFSRLQRGEIPDQFEDSILIEIIKQTALSKLFNEAKNKNCSRS